MITIKGRSRLDGIILDIEHWLVDRLESRVWRFWFYIGISVPVILALLVGFGLVGHSGDKWTIAERIVAGITGFLFLGSSLFYRMELSEIERTLLEHLSFKIGDTIFDIRSIDEKNCERVATQLIKSSQNSPETVSE
jgi:hypothetical protein